MHRLRIAPLLLTISFIPAPALAQGIAPPASQPAAQLPSELLVMPRTAPPSSAPAQVLSISCDDVPDLLVKRNYQLLSATLGIEGARASLLQARLYPNPSLSGSLSNIALGDRRLPAGVAPGPGDRASDEPWIENVTLSQLIVLWGKRSAAIDAARYGVDVAGAHVDDLLRTLRGAAVEQCFATLALSMQVDEQRRSVASFNSVRLLNRKRYEAGAISYGDYEKIELQYQGEALALQQAQLQAQQAMVSFKQLLAIPAGTDLRIDDTLDPPGFVDENRDYAALALENRPDVREARLALEQDGASYALARAQGLPDVTIGAGYTYDRNLGDFGSSLNVQLGVDLPLFNRNQGAIQLARITLRQDQVALEQVRAQVALDVKSALSQYEIAKEALLVYRTGLPGTSLGAIRQAEEVRDIARRQYAAGSASLIDLISAERDFNSEVIAYLQAEAALVGSIVSLQQAVGKASIPMVPLPPPPPADTGAPAVPPASRPGAP